jgi:hypothetical protein
MRALTDLEVLQFIREFMHFVAQFRQCGFVLACVLNRRRDDMSFCLRFVV